MLVRGRMALICSLALLLCARGACADPLQKPADLVELANALAELGLAKDDLSKVRRAIALYKEARESLEAMDAATMSEGMRNRRGVYLDTIRSRLAMCDKFLKHEEKGPDLPPPDVKPKPQANAPIEPLPKRPSGQRVEVWLRKVIAQYERTEDEEARATYAHDIMREGGVNALRAMFKLFEGEELPPVREAIHEALASFGTSRVANQMRSYATRDHERHWHHALDVIYRCLRKPDGVERERPFQRAIRAFHRLEERALTRRIIWELDQMGKEGVAALGEVIYVPNFGYHDHVIGLLGGKADRRAVPPLVYKMNRFKFEYRVQLPAHRALLQLGWHAVEELIDRLDDKAAGIWISWTLRKITTETMGTDKRKWHDWWKSEKKRHPELFDDPEERVDVTPGGARKGR